MILEFIETPNFTEDVQQLLSDEEYFNLQADLIKRPGLGRLIPGGAGLRKMRWGAEGKGKRGGLRIIYYWLGSNNQIYMIHIYSKTEQDDMSKDQLKRLAKWVQRGVL